ncbi:MAG: ABC transporter substrate-binding protein, partial [Alphaproteobacteria bacterium]|nr:ABC transporter substrate-binding protein [Alphaproteobacteria bacterium]
IGMQQEPTGLDPTQDATAAIEAILSHNVIESLTSLDSKGQVMPGLAESWTVSPDGTRYVFRLIGNAAFHNGRPLAAEDVKFSFERAMAADSTNPEKARFQKIAEVKAPDPRSVEITLKKPDNLFLFYLSSGKAAVFPKEALADFKTKPMGSGPYRFERWTKGESIVLVRNDAHRDAAKARMRQVTFRFIQDPNAAVAALLSGSLDAFPTVPAPETLAQFKTDIRFKVESGSTEGEVILALNNGKAPFNDIRVRRAIAHAIDRKSIIDGAMFGYGTPIGSHFPPHNPYYVDLTGRYPHDIAKSKALLAEAGHPGGFDASIKLPPFPYARRSGEIIAAQLAAVGIRLKIEAVEWAQWIGPVFREGQYDMTVIAHVSPWDIDNYAKGPSYYYRYHNPQFDALLERITASIDPATTKALYQDAQRFIAEESVHAFLFQLANAGVYRAGLAGYWVDVPAPYQPLIGWRWTN